jgi:UDP-N-acetyl-D-mannosaminuronic acid dehydrogenase
MCKLTENSFRDVNIAFANELSIICEKLDINVWELIKLANRHPRVNILQPGPGVGGHCIAVDPWFIVSRTPDEARIIRTARQVNDHKPEWVVSQVRKSVEECLPFLGDKGFITVACYGIAFKADIDDLRESPALSIVRAIIDNFDVEVLVVEPNVNSLPQSLEGGKLVTFEHALNSAQIHVMLVDHKEFGGAKLPEGIIVDAKGLWH